jgi:hypothetical protein
VPDGGWFLGSAQPLAAEAASLIEKKLCPGLVLYEGLTKK